MAFGDETLQTSRGPLVVETCCNCGVVFGVPQRMYENKREGGGFFTCPNGHSIGWNKDGCENTRLRRRAERAEQTAARLEEEAQAAKRQAAAARGQVTKIKRRASGGTCPCCNRTFANMARHMQSQHPEFVAEQGGKVVPIKKPA